METKLDLSFFSLGLLLPSSLLESAVLTISGSAAKSLYLYPHISHCVLSFHNIL